MSRQRIIKDGIWRSDDLENLNSDEQVVFLYFFSSPYSNIIGAYKIVPRLAASDARKDLDSQFIPAIRTLIDAGHISFDWETNYVWVKKWWEHNSAKGAVATTLRDKSIEQIAALPLRWRDEYIADFIDRLPTADNLRITVAADLGYQLNGGPIAYVYVIDSRPGSATTPIPYGYPSDSRPGNTTTNSISISNTTNNSKVIHTLYFPHDLRAAESQSITNLLSPIPPAAAQLLMDELAAAASTPGTIKTTKAKYLRGMIKKFHDGSFAPTAGIPITARRTRDAAGAEQQSAGAVTPEGQATGREKATELLAQIARKSRTTS